MAKTKSTKKFEKRHLKDSLKRRKDFKSKQKLFSKKRRSDRDDDRAQDDGNNEDTLPTVARSSRFEDMTVDEFFQDAFEVPEVSRKKRKRGGAAADKGSSKRTKAKPEEEPEGEVEDSDGGRNDDASEISLQDNAGGGTVELPQNEDESDSGDDEETHKEDLNQLAKKDPEFYKYLTENDAELLEFEDGDFEDIDELSDEGNSTKKKKSQKEKSLSPEDARGSLNLALVARLERAMIELKSLRSTREVVLAFRAAAHMNDDTKKDYKYTITNSDGLLSL
jgi:nucleolar complex protein 2